MYAVKYIFCALLMLLAISDLSSADVWICGKSLAQFLDMICVQGFNAKNLKVKKSVPLIDSNENLEEKVILPLEFSVLTLIADPNNLMTKTRRRRFDGVADECCRKSCDMSELLSYCL